MGIRKAGPTDPNLRVIFNPNPEKSTTSRVKLRVVGGSALGVGRASPTTELTPLPDTGPGSLVDRGDKLLELVVLLRTEYSTSGQGDKDSEKVQLLLFKIGQLAHTQQPNLEWYIVGEEKFTARSTDQDYKYDNSCLYDAFETFEEILKDVEQGIIRDSDLKNHYPALEWDNLEASRVIVEGFRQACIILNELAPIYQKFAEGLVQATKEILLTHGMGLTIPGPTASDFEIRSFEIAKKNLIAKAWQNWLEKRVNPEDHTA